MGRNIVAVIVGLVVGMALNMTIVQLNTLVFYPMPEGTTTADTEKFNAYLETLPALAFVVAMVAHLVQATVGGWLAARLGHSRPKLLAMIVGVLSLIGGVMAYMMFKGPSWMMIEFPLYLILAGLVGKLEANRRARKSS
ncbi:MAG: hypothetical protein ACYTDT_01225 [Planctomycetota bacterium]|jgi:MFS family permease